ncbi:lycopene cyclase domain-containing protein [Candidatus Saccharibacteria bacterium]|nr:lycopene cyclase domain-containing protein [Candidatus Saccharibacteria bacterium]
MMTYLFLNLLFLLTLLMFIPKKFKKPPVAWWITLGGLVILTALFDPLIIYFSIVDYDPTKILGIRLLGAPVEDFFYALYAACIVPLIWNRLGEKK